MKAIIRMGLVGVAAVALSACAPPEAECKQGVDQMKARLNGLIGSSQHQDPNDPVVLAATQVDIAQNQSVVGNFKGCLESLEQARAMLNRGTRTNQQ